MCAWVGVNGVRDREREIVRECVCERERKCMKEIGKRKKEREGVNMTALLQGECE